MVVNAMNVAAPQQVMLEVRFLEVNRTAGRDLGVNLFAANASGSNVGNTGVGEPLGAGPDGTARSPTARVPVPLFRLSLPRPARWRAERHRTAACSPACSSSITARRSTLW